MPDLVSGPTYWPSNKLVTEPGHCVSSFSASSSSPTVATSDLGGQGSAASGLVGDNLCNNTEARAANLTRA